MAESSQTPYGGFSFPPHPPPPPSFPQVQQTRQGQHGPHSNHTHYQPSTPLVNAQQPPPPPSPLYPQYPFNTLPGLHSQSYAQNMVQPPSFPPWPAPPTPNQAPYNVPFPPYIPPNGYAVPPPPFPPPGIFPPPQPVHSAPSPAATRPPPSVMAQQELAANSRKREVVESDKEEGEVSEGDGMPTSSRNSVRNAPRSVPVSTPGTVGSRGDNNGRDAIRVPQAANRDAAHNGAPSSKGHPGLEMKREQAKSFLNLLHENRIGFPELSAEGLDSNMLRQLYQDLGIAVPTAAPATTARESHVSNKESPLPITPSTSSTPISLPPTIPEKPVPAVKTNVAQDPSKSAPSPVDRKEYIARLQAAKMSKQANAAKDAPPKPAATQVPDPKITAPSQPASTAASTGAKKPTVTKSDAEKARQTELIKQRLELLKAQGKIPSSGTSTPQASDNIDGARKPGQTVSRTERSTEPSRDQAGPSFQIPGLFLNSPTSTVTKPPESGTSDNNTHPLNRKRPVASDLDDDRMPPQSTPLYTRPLGQSPHEHHKESLIIDVSEDESEGSDMDLDDIQTEQPPAIAPLGSALGNEGNLPRSQVPTADQSSRSASVNPTRSSVNTPPSVRTPAGFTTEELLKHEKAILDLKSKIAKMTEKKKATEASKDSINSSPIPRQHGSTEKRRQRRAELESALRNLDRGLEKENGRLAQLEMEILDIRAKREQYQRDRENLLKELETYGIETEGMDDEELLTQKAEISQNRNSPITDKATSLLSNFEMPSATQPSQASANGVQFAQPQGVERGPEIGSVQKDAIAIPIEPRAGAQTSLLHEVSGDVIMEDAPEKSTAVSSADGAQDDRDERNSPIRSPAIENPVDSATSIDDEDFYSPEPGAVKVPSGTDQSNKIDQEDGQVGSPSEEGEVAMSESSTDDEEEEYMPEEPLLTSAPATAPAPAAVPGSVAPELAHAPPASKSSPSLSSTEGRRLFIGNLAYAITERELKDFFKDFLVESTTIPTNPRSSRPAGYAFVSLSTPSETERAIAELNGKAILGRKVSIRLARSREQHAEGTGSDAELYEPPEPIQNQPNDQMVDASTSASDMHVVDDRGAMDISPISSDDSDAALELSSSDGLRDSISTEQSPRPGITIADDLAPELQGQAPSTVPPAVEPATEDDSTSNRPTFAPYKSPLRMFKSYRYHPNYRHDVAGGFLSLTYSHQIDPHKPLCRFESVGGTCNDSHCQGQHFQDMSISGDKLLVQLGTANPGKTPEERQRWNDGLKLVLKELRQEKIKNDPDRVAMEIAKYRSRFFGDDTRVVNL